MVKKYSKYGIQGYNVINEEDGVKNDAHEFDFQTHDVEFVRRVLAAVHKTSTGNIKYVRLYPIYHEGFEPKLK